jgi:hypothetical protein
MTWPWAGASGATPRRAAVRAQPEQRVRPGPQRAWLDVPYADKGQAKMLGARYDGDLKRWYAPRPGMHAMRPWEPLPEILPGEDRDYGHGLFVDLIPSTSWLVNVRSAVSERDWFRIRQMAYRRAGWRCEACGAWRNAQAGLLLEAHERFTYDMVSGVQRLVRIIALCTACHGVTHFGRAQATGEAEAAMSHLQWVTGMASVEAERHVAQAFALWERRSGREWTLDLSILADAGVSVSGPPVSLVPELPVPAVPVAGAPDAEEPDWWDDGDEDDDPPDDGGTYSTLTAYYG